jgi:hypothetical protein
MPKINSESHPFKKSYSIKFLFLEKTFISLEELS